MADLAPQDQEQQVKKLKRLLEGWRMALIPLKSVILWEQQWHPCAIIGSISFLYIVIWLLDLNSLATVAVLGLIFNFIDFIVPVVSNSLYGPSAWTGQKEKMFEEICRSIIIQYNKLMQQMWSFYSLRDTSPCMYYIISIGMLCTLAWVASTINNIFLLYVLSVVMLMWPGVQHRGALNSLLSLINMAPKMIKSE
ncbi:unnamed protein product [Diatraea saccharalis]|uniref:ADP-ribosylation factor-like protein 6-interacting protein 1 n=1 Tax=Diatraea saccharalis TaxID=40085 RepID=A0A9N9W7Q7_9NEOP|nr:unnamed protein product [Diatraea saccharalis]